jgi:hypothetical protein
MEQEFFNVIPNRDASHAIRGFFYQIETTIKRWLQLESDQFVLELESGEDIDIIPGALLDREPTRFLEQIKLRASTLSFHSPEILQSLINFLVHARNNPTFSLQFRFLTNSQANLERKRNSTQNQPGLEIWNSIARGELIGNELAMAISHIRHLLRSAAQPATIRNNDWDLLRILVENQDNEFVDFIRCVEWSLGNADLAETSKQIEEILAHDLKIAGELLVRIHEKLVVFVLRKLSNSGVKRLTRSELREQIERGDEYSTNPALVAIIRSLLAREENQIAKLSEQLQSLSTELVNKIGVASSEAAVNILSSPVLISVLPTIIGGSRRSGTVDSWMRALSGVTWLAIRGENGAGKTQLAILLAEKVKNPIWIDLRDCAAEQMATAIDTSLLVASNSPKIPELKAWYSFVCLALPTETTIFVDDLPPEAQSPAVKRLLLLATAALGKQLRIVTTSWDAVHPPPSDYLGSNFLEILIPPFEGQEIREFCSNHSAPERLLSDSGFLPLAEAVTRRHPQLVAALVRYMEQHNWVYDSDVVNQLLRGEFADDIKLQTRRVLNKTLPDTTRELLYRLNVIGPVFNDDDVIRASRVPPMISLPMDKLADCTGVWVQRISKKKFVISALVQQLGTSNVSIETQKAIHEQKARSLMLSKTLNQVEAWSAILHFQNAGCMKDAAAVLLLVLEQFANHGGPVVEDFGLLEVWAHDDIPIGVPREVQIIIRAQQIRARARNGKSYSKLLERFDSLIASFAPQDKLAVFAACVLLATNFANHDYYRAIKYLLKALELEADVKHHFSQTELSVLDVIWLTSPSLDEPEYLLDLLGIVERLSEDKQAEIFGSRLAQQSTRFICDRYWMREADRPHPDWDALDLKMDLLMQKAKALNAKVLIAAVARAQIVVAVDYRKKLDSGLTVATDAMNHATQDPYVSFVVSYTLGVACNDLAEPEAAATWLTRAIEAYTAEMYLGEFIVRAHLSRAVLRASDLKRSELDYLEAIRWARQLEDISDSTLLRALGEFGIALWESGQRHRFYETWQEAIELTLTGKSDNKQWKEIFVLNANNSAYFMRDDKLDGLDGTMTRPFRGMYLRYSPLLASYYQPDIDWYMATTMVHLAETLGHYKDSSRWALKAVEMSSSSAIPVGAKSQLMYAVPQAIRERRYVEAIELMFESCNDMQNRDEARVTDWAKTHGRPQLANIASTRPKITSSINEELLSLAVIPIIVDLAAWRLSSPEMPRDATDSIVRKCRELSSQTTDPAIWSTVSNRVHAGMTEQLKDLVEQASLDIKERRDLAACIGYLFAVDLTNLKQTCARWISVLEWFQRRFAGSPLHTMLVGELVTKFWRMMLLQDPIVFRQPNLLTQKLNALDNRSNYLPSEVMQHVVRHLGLQVPPKFEEWLESSSGKSQA